MKLFLAGASFDPGYGGPAYSVPRLGQALAALGVNVGLWAADGSMAGAAPGVTRLGGTLSDALAQFGTPDVIHDNGIWMPHNHQIARTAQRRGIPRIVSLRGMLEPWALRQRRAKKKLAWLLYQKADLRRAALLHATAGVEAVHARALGLDGPYCVVANGVDLPAPVKRRKRGRSKTALFVSRVHPKKGLPMLLRAWATLRPEGWRLQIAGPDESGHAGEVSALIAELGLADEVSLLGPVHGDAKAALFAGADLFVLPSHSENFGIAIAEALAYELPVLTTRGTPWEILESHDCGWWVEPSEEAILQGLRAATALPDGRRREMGRRGAAMVAERFDWGSIAMQFQQQYRAMIA